MEKNNSPTKTGPPTNHPHNRGSTGWFIAWLIIIMVIGFAGTGYYLDTRLNSLEQKVLTQTVKVSGQTEVTLDKLKEARQDILANRAESAEFAKQFSTTLHELSTLLSSTVASFSEQTSKLALAIEQKEESSVEYIKKALEQYSKEANAQSNEVLIAVNALADAIKTTQQAALDAKSQSQSNSEQLVAMYDQLQSMNTTLSSGFTTLTDLSKQINVTLNQRFDQQSKSLANQITALQEASNQSLISVRDKMIALANENQSKLHKSIDNQTETLTGSLETVKGDLVKQTKNVSQTLTDLNGRVDNVGSKVDIGFAASTDSAETIRSDIAEMNYNLTGRTEDLLLEIADTGKRRSAKTEELSSNLEERIKNVETSVNVVKEGINENKSLLATANGLLKETQTTSVNLNDQLKTFSKDALSNIVDVNQDIASLAKRLDEFAQQSANASPESLTKHTQSEMLQLVQDLKGLMENMVSVRDSVAGYVDTVKTKATELTSNPKSTDAKDAFQKALDNLNQSIQSTQGQVDTIRKQLTGLTTKFKTDETPESVSQASTGEPIGMLTNPEEE